MAYCKHASCAREQKWCIMYFSVLISKTHHTSLLVRSRVRVLCNGCAAHVRGVIEWAWSRVRFHRWPPVQLRIHVGIRCWHLRRSCDRNFTMDSRTPCGNWSVDIRYSHFSVCAIFSLSRRDSPIADIGVHATYSWIAVPRVCRGICPEDLPLECGWHRDCFSSPGRVWCYVGKFREYHSPSAICSDVFPAEHAGNSGSTADGRRHRVSGIIAQF